MVERIHTIDYPRTMPSEVPSKEEHLESQVEHWKEEAQTYRMKYTRAATRLIQIERIIKGQD